MMILLGITLSATIGTFGNMCWVNATTTTTTNQTGKTATPPPSKQASQSIRDAIIDTGQFCTTQHRK
jgi:hypothetical protein